MNQQGRATVDVPLSIVCALERIPCRSIRSRDIVAVQELMASLRDGYDHSHPLRLVFDSDEDMQSFASGSFIMEKAKILDGGHRAHLMSLLILEAVDGCTDWYARPEATVPCRLLVIPMGHLRMEAAIAANDASHAVVRSGWIDALLLVRDLATTLPHDQDLGRFITTHCPMLLRACTNLRRTTTAFNRIESIGAWDAVRSCATMCEDAGPLTQTFWSAGCATRVLEYFLSIRQQQGVSQCPIGIAYMVLVNTQIDSGPFISKIRRCGVRYLVRLANRTETRSQFSLTLAAVALAIAFKRYLRTNDVPDCALFSDESMVLDEACLIDVMEDSKRNLPPFERTHHRLSDENDGDGEADEEDVSGESSDAPRAALASLHHAASSGAGASAVARSEAIPKVEPAHPPSQVMPEEQQDDTSPDVPREGADVSARGAAAEVKDGEDKDEEHKGDDEGEEDGPPSSSSMQVFLPRGDGPDAARFESQEEFHLSHEVVEAAEEHHVVVEPAVSASTNSERRGRVRASYGAIAEVTVLGQVMRLVRMLGGV